MEIMIVIFLIGLIAGAIGYNMRGSLNEGRAFRTQTASEQIRDILLLEVAKGNVSLKEAVNQPELCLKASGMVRDPAKLLKDGWGVPFRITEGHADIVVHSDQLRLFEQAKHRTRGRIDQACPETAAPENKQEDVQPPPQAK